MVETMYINNSWTFYPEEHPEQKKIVRLPHTNCELPFNYFDERRYQFVSVYEKDLIFPEEWAGSSISLRFEGIAQSAKVYLNGEAVGEHRNGYTQFTCPLEKAAKFGEINHIKVVTDARESQDFPPFGHVIDYLTYGGIYREVALEVRGSAVLDRLFVQAGDIYSKDKTFQVSFEAECSMDRQNRPITADLAVSDGSEVLMEKKGERVTVGSNTFRFHSDRLQTWDLEHPTIYELTVTLHFDGEVTDIQKTTFGLREAVFKRDGFYLNGKCIKLRGLDRHQSYPYVGYAMPASMQVEDAETLKYRLGLNAVRTSHYPQSKYFLDACDRLGLLVFTEAPGWQHIGSSSAWRDQHIQNVKEMILDDWNHPSVVLWGVRINESLDDDELYRRANDAAHALDPTRQTSGVRYLKHSHLLEDVYAFNDFSHTGKNAGVLRKELVAPLSRPYLISEHDGHMFPTKSYDCEEHRLSQALRHARVVNDALSPSNGISGVFGWCMADYNTHKDFGSGDRICYHGVLDMFRNPKLAAYFYESQSDDHDVLEISSSMDIGEHPGSWIGDIYAFTNADSVKMYQNGEYVTEFFPDREHFPNLPHPPILIDDLVGDRPERLDGLSTATGNFLRKAVKNYIHSGQEAVIDASTLASLGAGAVRDQLTPEKAKALFHKYSNTWGADVTVYRFEAIKDGEVVKQATKGPAMEFHLKTDATTTELKETTTYDVAEVRIAAVSEDGNILTYANDPLLLEVSGGLELIGPSVIPLRGGLAGVYVKTTGRGSSGTLTIRCGRCDDTVLHFKISY